VNFARTWAGQTGKARQLIQTLRRRFRRELLTRDEAHRIAAVFAKLPRPSSRRVARGARRYKRTPRDADPRSRRQMHKEWRL
jgi:hypothetical protein